MFTRPEMWARKPISSYTGIIADPAASLLQCFKHGLPVIADAGYDANTGDNNASHKNPFQPGDYFCLFFRILSV
jgi:hypothetical protein